MANTKKILSRNEIPREETWAIEDLFASDALWLKAYEEIQDELKGYETFRDKLNESADMLLACLSYNDKVEEKLEKIYVYARQKLDEDTTNSTYQDFAGKAQAVANKLNGAAAFIMPEILAMEEQRLRSFLASDNGISHYSYAIELINRKRNHTLSSQIEKLLAETREISEAPSQIFSTFNNADIQFPEITDEDGSKVRLTQGRYITFLESPKREVRQEAFEAMLGTYNKYKNTLAGTFSNNIKQASFYARTRNYSSTRDFYLSDSNVPESVYDNLIKTVHNNLHLLHRYVSLRKKFLGLKELHMYDLYVPMVSGVEQKINFEDAKTMVIEGLSPLGQNYLDVLKEGFNKRWIDIRENTGKRTGAYSWGAYGTHPYVLLNYQDNLSNVFTLAHEMGHALHSYFSDKCQSYTYAGYKIFVAEVASTCNEALLIQDLLGKTTENKKKAFLINDFLEKFRGTLFRQTMFAEFEMLTHRLSEQGETLTAEKLCSLYHELNTKYFGPDLVIDPAISIEWARIPHFYTPFYVYQYATGFSAAIALSDRILKEGEPAVKEYLKFLSGGGSMDPIALLKLAGINMEERTPIEHALKVFENLLDQIEQLNC